MHVSVHVRSGDPRSGGEMHTTTHCLMVLVALDPTGSRKVAVRSWNPTLPEDLALQSHAKRLIDICEQIARTAPREVPALPRAEVFERKPPLSPMPRLR